MRDCYSDQLSIAELPLIISAGSRLTARTSRNIVSSGRASRPIVWYLPAVKVKAPVEVSAGEAMKIALLVPLGCLLLAVTTSAQDQGRIKRKPPTNVEAERIASEIVMNDSLLQKGDIVVTDRGFFVFRGLAVDGYTYEFSPVPNPVLIGRPGR